MARSRMRSACLLLGSCAMLSGARSAGAAPLLVEWNAPACAQESAFRARVHDALRREPESALEQELRVSVRIAQQQGKVGYSLEIQTEAGRRQIETPSCDEAVAAAATLVALIIDPSALPSPPPPAPAEPPRPPPPRPPTRKPAPQAEPPARIESYVAAFGGVSLGEVPALSPLVGGAVGLRWRGLGVAAEGLWIAPQTELLPGRDKGGEIRLFGGGPSVCYSPLRGHWRLTGCLLGQAGAWRSLGVRVANPSEQTDWWLAGLGRLGAGLQVTPTLGLFLNGDVVVPARTPRFKLGGLGDVFQPSAIAGRFSAGVELGF